MLAVWLVSPSAEAQQTAPGLYSLHVDGLACPFCAYGIEKQLTRIEGVEHIAIDIETGRVLLTMARDVELNESTARKAIEAAGFSLRDFEQVQRAP